MSNQTNNKKNWPEYLKDIEDCGYAPEDNEILIWFANNALEKGVEVKDVRSLIPYNHVSIRRVYTGTYLGKTTSIINEMRRYRVQHNQMRRLGSEPPYVHTAITNLVWKAARHAMEEHRPVNLIGNTQRGKTRALEELTRQEGLNIVFVRCPVSPTPLTILKRIARALGCRIQNGNREICWGYIEKNLTYDHLLVIDEMHQCIFQKPHIAFMVIETIREIYDLIKCGLVMIGTPVWGSMLDGKEDMEAVSNPNILNRRRTETNIQWADVLEQIIKRGDRFTLSDELYTAEIEKFWQSYGLPEPSEHDFKIVSRIANNDGVGVLTSRLRDGERVARNMQQPYSWRHFFMAKDMADKLATGQISLNKPNQ